MLRLTLAAGVGAAVLALTQANAQAVGTRPSPAFTIEEQVQDRWLHGRQQSRYSPFDCDQSRVFVDSLRNGARDRTIFLTTSGYALKR